MADLAEVKVKPTQLPTSLNFDPTVAAAGGRAAPGGGGVVGGSAINIPRYVWNMAYVNLE